MCLSIAPLAYDYMICAGRGIRRAAGDICRYIALQAPAETSGHHVFKFLVLLQGVHLEKTTAFSRNLDADACIELNHC